MTRRFTIRDGAFDGWPKSLADLPAALAGMQAPVRKRCTVVEWHAVSEVPADEWLDRLRRGERETVPPDADDVETRVGPI